MLRCLLKCFESAIKYFISCFKLPHLTAHITSLPTTVGRVCVELCSCFTGGQQ